jgi:hypothetical protein
MDICPTCKRRMPKAKAPAEDKRLAQDIAKATNAIETMERLFTNRNDFADLTLEGLAIMHDAMRVEQARLRSAIENPRLLWGIYRRADKSAPYYSESPVVEPQSVPQAVAAEPEPELLAA